MCAGRAPVAYEHLFAYAAKVPTLPADTADLEHLRASLGGLATRVRPLSLARERVLPVHPALAPALPEEGLRRGSVVACTGQGAWSSALALTAAASQAGSWIAVVGLGALGMSAAEEWGIALDRVIAVPAVPGAQLPAVLAALVDGIDLVIADAAGIRSSDARRVAARLAQRGGVLVLVERVGGFSADLTCEMRTEAWQGIGDGFGRLVSRRVCLSVSGRRLGRERRLQLVLPAACDRLAVDRSSHTATAPVGGSAVIAV